MKTKLTLTVSALWLAVGLFAHAATNDLSSALQQGLFEEEANRNLPAAIAAYEAVAKQFEKDRALAATAVFRLGECYRKQGQTNEAAGQYERILREFADQQQLVTLSRQNLAGMGVKPPVPAAASLSRASRHEQARLLEQQIQLAEQDVAEAKKQFEVGRATQAEVRVKERAVLSLRVQLAALGVDPVESEAAIGSSSARSPEAQELERINQLIVRLNSLDFSQARRQIPALIPDAEFERLEQQLTKEENAQPTARTDEEKQSAEKQMASARAAVQKRCDMLYAVLTEAKLKLEAVVKQQQLAAGTGALAAAGKTTSVVIDDEETEIRRLQKMIQNSPDLINAPSGGAEDNYTPLGRAANKGQLRVAQFLLDSGAEVNRAYQSRTPLLLAATRGHKAMIELLLAKGADVNARDSGGKTALHIAAENGFQATVETLVAGKADVNARTTKQETPLHLAVNAGHVAMTKFLLGKGADADARNATGLTPLMQAAARAHSETTQTLLTAAAKPNLEDESGRTALSYAAERGHLESVKALLAAKADPNAGKILPLHLAIHTKATDVVQALLEAGADANRPGQITWQSRWGGGQFSSGITPLSLAISEGNAEAVKLLLAHKADPNSLGPDRLPVILQAARNPSVLEPLLKAGAKPNVDDGEGRTPLIFATADGVTEPVRLLLAHGADLEVRPFGSTPLLIAVDRCDQKSAEALLAAGAEVNARTTSEGRTALHLATMRRDPTLTALLLTNKADVNARDNSGYTPLDYAKGNSAARPPGLDGFVPGRVPMPMPMGGIPLLGVPGRSAPPAPANPTSITDLLREHGALDELPDFATIRVNRQGLEKPIEVFRRQTNDWNRFTLLETILGLYANKGLVAFEQAYAARTGVNVHPGSDFQVRLQNTINNASSSASTLWFPDLQRIIVHRPSRTPGGKEQVIQVNLLNATNGVDCAKDLTLEFGDVVEIPVRDHALSESPTPLSVPEAAGILGCLQRKVRLTVRGQSRELELRPTTAESFLGAALGKSEAKSQLLSSSDLTQVKVTRKEPGTGQPREFIVDVSKGLPTSADLWLRDGDVIEVPEK
jgi:ankyrin repeat protein